MYPSHVYVRALALGCFYSHISTQTPGTGLRHPSLFGKRCSECDYSTNLSEGADRVAGQLHGDKECPFNGVSKSGRVWRKVPESGARSVNEAQSARAESTHKGVTVRDSGLSCCTSVTYAET